MSVAQPAFRPAFDPPFGAMVARQVSVWPFAARTARLFLLVDPSLPDQALRRGLLRAVQQAYFGSDGYSQTRAVREAALAAHYVLRHHNRDVLPLDQINAASAVAALRGNVAYVALAGHAAAFAWRDGQLTGQRGILRLPRPLGLEQDPRISLWSTPTYPCDRLILVCNASWRPESSATIQAILESTSDASLAEQRLAEALGDGRSAGVLVITPGHGSKTTRHLRLVSSAQARDREPPSAEVTAEVMARPLAHRAKLSALRRWLTSLLGLALLATVVGAAFRIAPEVPGAPADSATQHATMLSVQDRVDLVSPDMAVRLGPSAANVVDLTIGDTSLYALDVVEGSVRAFPLDARNQLPTPETLLARAGTPIDLAGHSLATPIAMEYVDGGLVIVDQARTVVQIDRDGHINRRSVPTSSTWQALGALGADSAGHFLFLDSGSRRLLEYPSLNQRVVDPPRSLLDASSAPGLAFDRVAEFIGLEDALVARLDDGTIQRFGADGLSARVVVRTSDGRPTLVRSMTPDRSGGLYLADPVNARVVHTTADGTVLRELHDPALAGVRQIQSSPDGHRLFGLVASGVLVFDTPDL